MKGLNTAIIEQNKSVLFQIKSLYTSELRKVHNISNAYPFRLKVLVL
jgi:hypothetical protein